MVKTFSAGPQALLGREGPKGVKSGQNSVSGPSEIAKTLSLIGKTHMEKTNAPNLIKPVEGMNLLSKLP